MGRKPISKKLRFGILSRDLFACQYCGEKSPDAVLHVDHIWPVSAGGTNEEWNLVTACQDCNSGKRDSHIRMVNFADSFVVIDALHEAFCQDVPVREILELLHSCKTDEEFHSLTLHTYARHSLNSQRSFYGLGALH